MRKTFWHKRKSGSWNRENSTPSVTKSFDKWLRKEPFQNRTKCTVFVCWVKTFRYAEGDLFFFNSAAVRLTACRKRKRVLIWEPGYSCTVHQKEKKIWEVVWNAAQKVNSSLQSLLWSVNNSWTIQFQTWFTAKNLNREENAQKSRFHRPFQVCVLVHEFSPRQRCSSSCPPEF